MVLVLPDLAAILILFGALIFIYLCVGIAKALFGVAGGTVGKLPVVGGWINSGLHTVEHKIVSTMTGWAEGVDEAVGWSLHQLAREVDWIGREIEAHANLLYTLGAITLGPGFAAATNSSLKFLYQHIHAVEAGAASALHRLTLAEKRLAHSVAQGVYPRLRAAEHAIAHTIPKDVAGLRSRTKTIEGEVARAWKAIRANEAALAATAMVGVVALALEKLGGSWIRCSNWNRVGRQVCGVPAGDLEGLLGLFVAGAVIADFRELVKLAQTVEHGVAAGLQEVAKL